MSGWKGVFPSQFSAQMSIFLGQDFIIYVEDENYYFPFPSCRFSYRLVNHDEDLGRGDLQSMVFNSIINIVI